MRRSFSGLRDIVLAPVQGSLVLRKRKEHEGREVLRVVWCDHKLKNFNCRPLVRRAVAIRLKRNLTRRQKEWWDCADKGAIISGGFTELAGMRVEAACKKGFFVLGRKILAVDFWIGAENDSGFGGESAITQSRVQRD